MIAIMWWVMMVAMMVPAASPTILLYARVHRHSNGLEAAPPTAAFLAGYLACWLGFALIAAGLQIWLISPMPIALASDRAAGGLLIAAGVLPAFAVQERLPQPLSFAGDVPQSPLSPGRAGRVSARSASRSLLRRLLLAVDGAAVRRRGHEPNLGSQSDNPRSSGETSSRWSLVREDCGDWDGRRWGRSDFTLGS